MNRSDVTELHYIAPVANLQSILQRGILSHAGARRYLSMSVADDDVQARRAIRDIPGGLKLHQYANLYFNARNAMLYKITRSPVVSPANDLAILRVHPSVLDRTGVVITETNAAAGIHPRWHPVEAGLAVLRKEQLFAEYWTSSEERKQRMMAEVLVPSPVPPTYVTGAYVVSENTVASLPQAACRLDVEVCPYMFFQGPRA